MQLKHLNLNINIDSELGSWAICSGLAALLTAIIYPFLRVVILSVIEHQANKRAQEKVKTLRVDAAAPQQQVRVRQTDLTGSMTAEDKQRHAQAEQLLAQGQVREAAVIFEAIKFQRRAVDVLEKAQLIDDACAVLLRLKVPNRAAILYERNGHLEKAAQLFLEAGESGSAARVFLVLSKKDFHYAQAAADAFQRIGKAQESLDCLAMLLNTEKILSLCLAAGNLTFIAAYMRGRKTISDIFGRLPAEYIEALCAAVPQSPQGMSTLASWTECSAAQPALLEIIKAATRSKELAAIFTSCLTELACSELRKNMARITLPPDQLVHLQLALQVSEQPLAKSA